MSQRHSAPVGAAAFVAAVGGTQLETGPDAQLDAVPEAGPEATDVELCETIRAGLDEHGLAVEQLFVRHRPPALAYARKLSGGSSVSDDLVAEAFLKTWQRLVGGRRVASFGPYLMRAVRNGYIDSLRRDRALTLETPQDVALHPAFTVADRSASVDDADLVRILFARMVPRHRHVIWLRAVEGYSTSEIAEALGIKANAAAVLLHRARKAMIAAYQDLDEASVA